MNTTPTLLAACGLCLAVLSLAVFGRMTEPVGVEAAIPAPLTLGQQSILPPTEASVNRPERSPASGPPSATPTSGSPAETSVPVAATSGSARSRESPTTFAPVNPSSAPAPDLNSSAPVGPPASEGSAATGALPTAGAPVSSIQPTSPVRRSFSGALLPGTFTQPSTSAVGTDAAAPPSAESPSRPQEPESTRDSAPLDGPTPSGPEANLDPEPAPETPAAAIGSHPFLDATTFDTEVDWGDLVVPKLVVVYPGELGFRRDEIWDELPPDDVIAERVRRLPDADTYCIDVEHWPVVTDNDEARALHIGRLRHLLAIFRGERPGARLGYWGLFPRYTYLGAHRWPTPSNAGIFAGEQRLNRAAGELIDDVDVIFPSLYAMEDGQGNPPKPALWETRAMAILDEAGRSGKPVIAFLWTAKDWDEGFWQMQLEVAAEGADAVAIWGHAAWSKEERWYRVLTETIARSGTRPSIAYD